VTPIGEKRNACMLLEVKPGDKSALIKPGRICDDNIKIDLKDIG
jgi:hypothetical protein